MSQTETRRNTRPSPPASVYERIKASLVRHEFPAGRRISVEPLADALFVSATPVREALTRLSVERIVQDMPNAGFFTKLPSQSELCELFDLQELLLDWSSLRARSRAEGPAPLKPPNYTEQYRRALGAHPDELAILADALFLHLARQSGNEELIIIIENLNTRTRFARENCFKHFSDPGDHFHAICEAYASLDFDAVRTSLALYFQSIRDRLPALFRTFARAKIRTAP